MKTLALDDVQGHDGDIMGLSKVNVQVEEKDPPGSRSARVPPR
jgi:hypothetical protein